jgi:hypothetical protein
MGTGTQLDNVTPPKNSGTRLNKVVPPRASGTQPSQAMHNSKTSSLVLKEFDNDVRYVNYFKYAVIKKHASTHFDTAHASINKIV